MNKEINENQREKRAKAIQAMGLVNREGDHFKVFTPSIKGREKWFEVRRDHVGAVICNCPEFLAEIHTKGFRCEHILAVKHALLTPQAAEAKSLEVNNQTESRVSSRGEQELKSSTAEVLFEGPDRNAKAKTMARIAGEMEKVKQSTGFTGSMAEFFQFLRTDKRFFYSSADELLAGSRKLAKTIDPKLVKQREGWRDRNGNVQTVDYVEWHTVADILDDVAPHWTHTVKDIKEIGDIMTVTVAITIDGVTREGIGTGNAHNEMGIKKAEHDALKRAAVKFGIARELYKKESDVIERDGALASRDDDGGFPDQPVAKNLGELVTAKQLGMIRALARELRIDADEECNSVMQCRSDELSKSAASSFIKHLQEMQRPSEIERMPLRRAS